MALTDKIDFYGVFNIKSIDKNNNIIDEFTDKNLIMDSARANMARLLGNVTTGDAGTAGQPIDRFIIGTQGHVDNNVLNYKRPGNDGFTSDLVNLFSVTNNGVYYEIPFIDSNGDPISGTEDEQIDIAESYMWSAGGQANTQTGNIVRRIVAPRSEVDEKPGRVLTYIITIQPQNGNWYIGTPPNEIPIAFTEAGLYTGGDIFSMKTFPARVKDDTVKFEITWSIIF